MKKCISLIVSCLILASGAVAQDDDENKRRSNTEKPTYYSPDSKGWFFYDESIFLKNEEEPEIQQPTPEKAINQNNKSEPTQVALDVTWLRDNMPQMLDDMQNNPTDENIARYVFAQRLLLDMSSRVSTNVMRFMEENPILDENNRRPTTGMDLVTFKGQVADNRKSVMSKIADKAHVWFFYKSTCDFCHRQIPILQAFYRRYGVTVLAVSMDGPRIAGMDNFSHRVDTNRFWTQQMNITRTPTLMLMMNDGSGFTKLTNGLETLPFIEDRIMTIGRQMDLITEEELEKAQDVLDINSLKKVDGTLLADKNRLETDANYFAELVRAQIELNGEYFGNSNVVTPEEE